jgi:hypothetical protein
MLGIISEEEKKIIELKAQGDLLNKEHQGLRLEEENLNISKKKDEVDMSQEEK